jgi:hypothetical protein
MVKKKKKSGLPGISLLEIEVWAIENYLYVNIFFFKLSRSIINIKLRQKTKFQLNRNCVHSDKTSHSDLMGFDIICWKKTKCQLCFIFRKWYFLPQMICDTENTNKCDLFDYKIVRRNTLSVYKINLCSSSPEEKHCHFYQSGYNIWYQTCLWFCWLAVFLVPPLYYFVTNCLPVTFLKCEK